MDEDIDPPLAYHSIEEGDRLFILDWDAYVREGSQERIVLVNHKKPDYLMEFWDLFNEKEFDQLPKEDPGIMPSNLHLVFSHETAKPTT